MSLSPKSPSFPPFPSFHLLFQADFLGLFLSLMKKRRKEMRVKASSAVTPIEKIEPGVQAPCSWIMWAYAPIHRKSASNAASITSFTTGALTPT